MTRRKSHATKALQDMMKFSLTPQDIASQNDCEP